MVGDGRSWWGLGAMENTAKTILMHEIHKIRERERI